jgi:hypothetical protein
MTNMHWLVFTLCSALVLLIAIFIYLHQYIKLIGYLWEISFAFLGLFIGFYLDFGITDILVLYELCGQGNMFAIAPTAATGMFIGCNLRMFVTTKSKINISHLLSVNLGMLIGMLIFEYFNNLINILNPPFSMLIHLAAMIFFGHMFYFFPTLINHKKIKCICFNLLRVVEGK